MLDDIMVEQVLKSVIVELRTFKVSCVLYNLQDGNVKRVADQVFI